MSAKLEIRNLVKRFGGLTATNDLSFDVSSGESVGLIGPNGAGKTTWNRKKIGIWTVEVT